MKKRWIPGALLLLTAVSPYSDPQIADAGEILPRVTRFQAQLFYGETGNFSPNVLDNPDFWLWNAPIGEGSAESNSNATLVLVEVTGDPDAFDLGYQLSFSASYTTPSVDAGGNPFLRNVHTDETVDLCGFGPDGTCFLGFWLNETGCTPVTLRAHVSGPPEETSLENTILFECGE